MTGFAAAGWRRTTVAGILLATSLAFLLAGCEEKKTARRGSARAEVPKPTDPAEADAAELGQHIFALADFVDSYRSSHRGRLPRSLRQLGQDSIAGPIVRRISTSGGGTVTAAFRRPEEHVLHWCTGNLRVLEEAALRGDAFEVTCGGVDGQRRVTVQRRYPGL